MGEDVGVQVEKGLAILFWPLVWPHEYCHYWVARRLGLLARIGGARTFVHHATIKQHLLIASAPTVPSVMLLALAILAYRILGISPSNRLYFGGLAVAAIFIVLSCARDWWSMLQGLLDRDYLTTTSEAILIVSASSPADGEAVVAQIEKLGYFVGWAGSPQAALATIERNPLHLIVLDKNIPDLDQGAIRKASLAWGQTDTIPLFQLKSHAELARLSAYLQLGVPQERF